MDTLLDVFRLQSHAPRLELEDVEAAVVRDAVARLEQEAARVGCQLVLSPLPSMPGRWDRVRMAQVVRHLLANAMKFGPGKPVEVALEALPRPRPRERPASAGMKKARARVDGPTP